MELEQINNIALQVVAAIDPIDEEEDDLDDEAGTWIKVTVDRREFLLMGSATFSRHFRMRRETFEELVEVLSDHLHNDEEWHHAGYDLTETVLMVLWILATPDTFRSVALQFGVTPGIVHFHYKKIIGALCQLADRYVTWPSVEERERLSRTVEERTGFPGVIGAVDGTHIPVFKPYVNPNDYFNRHHDYSVILQAVADENLLFRDIYVGQPGGVHDSRVFRRSPLCRKFLEDDGRLVGNDQHILGDGAYICTDKVLTPFRHHGDLADEQKNYNRRHASSRVRVEQSFALLKGKWRRLKYLSAYNMRYVIQTVVACTVLHNFILLQGEVPQVDQNAVEVVQPQVLDVDHDIDPNVDHPDVILERDHPLLRNARNLGVEKRNDVMGRLPPPQRQ